MTKKPRRKSPVKPGARKPTRGDALGTNEVKGASPEARDMTRKSGSVWARVRGFFGRPR